MQGGRQEGALMTAATLRKCFDTGGGGSCAVALGGLGGNLASSFFAHTHLLYQAILPVQQSGAACDLTLPLAGGRLRDVLFGDVWFIPDICHFFYMDRVFYSKLYTKK